MKFEALFGQISRDHKSRLRSQNAIPVAVATFIMAVGWVFVASPESVWNRSLVIPSSFAPSGLPPFPMETVRFAFLGAYFYILQMVVRRYFQGDLKPNAYLHATMRVIMAVLLVWTIDPLMADRAQAQRNAIAFVIGVFPLAGWQLLTSLIFMPARWIVPSLKPDHPLDGIEGLNVWYQSRLLELGIEDMQNLATTSFVDLMLNTRIPIGRLVDWVDQAILMLHIDGKHKRTPNGETDLGTLRRLRHPQRDVARRGARPRRRGRRDDRDRRGARQPAQPGRRTERAQGRRPRDATGAEPEVRARLEVLQLGRPQAGVSGANRTVSSRAWTA